MEYKPIKTNGIKESMETFAAILMILAVPASISNIITSDTVAKIIIHSLFLMYFTSELTVKVFAWKIKGDD